MKVERLTLEHFKCFGESDLHLDDGVTVIHGVNGSGKSTLLEAIFFALYGARALDDRTLEDVITTGEAETGVTCWFAHDGGQYHVERRVKRRSERATTTKCVLETPNGSIEGARDVRAYVTDLLRMDADAFVNCAYVRQGEVNKLIHASPRERQNMIDELLQLGSLETYRERANDARLGVEDVRREVRGEANSLEAQIDEKLAKGLHDRLNDLETERSEVTDQIDHYEGQRDDARRSLEQAREVIERHEETAAEIERLTDSIDALTEKIKETDREREQALERIRDRRSQREDLADEREDVLEEVDLDGTSVEERLEELEERDEDLRDELESLRVTITELSAEEEQRREAADELETVGEEKRSEATTLEEALERDEASIEEAEDRIEVIESERGDLRARFDDAPIAIGEAADRLEALETEREEIRSAMTDVTSTIRSLETAIEEGESLLDAGKCPECGQPVEESPHVDVLDDRREALAAKQARYESLEADREAVEDRIERAEALCEVERRLDRLVEKRDDLTQLLEQRRESLDERRERRARLDEEIDDAETDAETNRTRAEEIAEEVADHRAELGEINAERGELADERASLTRATEIDDERSALADEIETIRERISDWESMNDERREQLSETRDRKRTLEAEFDEETIEAAEAKRDRAQEYLEQVEDTLADLADRREALTDAIGGVRNELEELEALRERRADIEDRLESLESLYDQAETLQSTYGELRAELRQRNVDTLERLLNETFELIYQNDAYAGIDLDGEYRLTVYQKDDEPLDPEQLSGGERALFNLSLRCAIYRLLAEGVEGAAPMPPLILDEPTVFLDSGHVTQLVSLVESMRDLGVEQILVVSHDEELVGAADDVVRVEKDATSNRSSLTRREPRSSALASVE